MEMNEHIKYWAHLVESEDQVGESSRWDKCNERNEIEKSLIKGLGQTDMKAVYELKYIICSPTNGKGKYFDDVIKYLTMERDLNYNEISRDYSGGGGNWTGD